MSLKDIVKTNNIIVSSPEDSLAATLAKLSTSHDAAFVFDNQEKLLGVVNPYFCLIKTSFPGNAKLQNCLFHPPHLDINAPLAKVAQLMSESKMHYLPVYENKTEFRGIISARRLLSSVLKAPIFNLPIAQVIRQKRALVTIYEDDFLSKALALFKLSKVSKLIVIGRDTKLKGVLSYYDIIAYLMMPKRREHIHHNKLKNFAKSYVLTLPPTATMNDALKLIIEKKIGSVVIVDPEKHPIGIITTADFLWILRRGYQQKISVRSITSLAFNNGNLLGNFLGSLTSLGDIRDRVRRFVN